MQNPKPLQFQFHYGSIKMASEKLNRRIIMGFNSTMVRLKSLGENPTVETLRGFNSTMVRLKSHCLRRAGAS